MILKIRIDIGEAYDDPDDDPVEIADSLFGYPPYEILEAEWEKR